MLCDMHCNMMQVMETHSITRRHKRASSGHRTRALVYRDRAHLFNCAHGRRAARMDDYDESERSLSPSTARVKDSSHHKTAFGFHPCNRYKKWCVQDSVQESGPCLSNVDTGWRERDTN